MRSVYYFQKCIFKNKKNYKENIEQYVFSQNTLKTQNTENAPPNPPHLSISRSLVFLLSFLPFIFQPRPSIMSTSSVTTTSLSRLHLPLPSLSSPSTTLAIVPAVRSCWSSSSLLTHFHYFVGFYHRLLEIISHGGQ